MTDFSLWISIIWPLVGLAVMIPFIDHDDDRNVIWTITAFSMIAGPILLLPILTGLAMESMRVHLAARDIVASAKLIAELEAEQNRRPHAQIRLCHDTADHASLDAFLRQLAADPDMATDRDVLI